MSENVVKLRIDSREYESKIKNVSSGLSDFFRKVREGSRTFANLDAESIKTIRSMGDLATSASSTRGGLRELTQAIVDMTADYRSLTDEEKKSPVGQAMAESIQKMTVRAGQMKDAMEDVSGAIQHEASDTRVFDQLAGAATIATSAFQTLQGGAKILGIEMGDNLEIIAKLQAAMAVTNGLSQIQAQIQSHQAVMQGVLNLQTKAGAIAQELLAKKTALATAAAKAFDLVAKSSHVGLLVTVVGGLVAAYTALSSSTDSAKDAQKRLDDALKDLNNTIAITRQNADFAIDIAKATGTATKEIIKMRLETAKATMEMLRARKEAAIVSGKEAAANFDVEGVARYKAIVEEIDKAMARTGEEIKKAGSELQTLTKERAAAWEKWRTANTEAEINALKTIFKQMQSEVEIGSALYNSLGGIINNLDSRLPKDKKIKNTTNNKGSNTTKQEVEGPLRDLEKEMEKLQLAQKGVTNAEDWLKYEERIKAVKQQVKELKGELGLSSFTDKKVGKLSASISDMVPTSDKILGTREDFIKKNTKGLQNLKINVPEKKEGSVVDVIGKMNSGIQSIVSGIEGLGIEIPQGMKDILSGIQGVISVLSAINTIVATIQTIQTISSWKFWSTGGIVKAATGMVVPGNFGYDAVPSLLSSGEVVLNRAQAGVLAAELGGQNNNNTPAIMPYVSGQMIFLGTNNYLKGSGQGEIVTTKMLKQYGLV